MQTSILVGSIAALLGVYVVIAIFAHRWQSRRTDGRRMRPWYLWIWPGIALIAVALMLSRRR